MNHYDDDWAVFWCSLLGPILLDEVTAGERRRYLKQLSQQEVTLPNGQRKRISYSTLRRKVQRYRQQKIAGLRRRRRQDRGQPRKQRQAMIARAVELKREQPRRSPRTINKILAKEFGRTIPTSTMNRHFRQQGVTRRKLGVEQTEKIRCRWTRDQSNALWVGDFSDGPTVIHARPRHQVAPVGLDRLPQPLRRRRPLLLPREPGHPDRFPAARLGQLTAPVGSCTSTTRKSIIPAGCGWPARS